MSGSKWTATTTTTVKTTSGTAIPGAVVTFTVRSWKGSTFTDQTASATTLSNGTVAYTTPQLQWNGGSPVTKVDIIVTNVTPPAGYTWNGVTPSVSANKP